MTHIEKLQAIQDELIKEYEKLFNKMIVERDFQTSKVLRSKMKELSKNIILLDDKIKSLEEGE